MTKYVISGYIGFDNFGDEAICGVLTKYLKSLGAEKITVLSLNPGKTSNLYGVDSSPMLKFIKPIIESDILISGGGSLLQDITSLKSLIYYLLVIITALIFHKKVYIFAQGFTPFRTKIGEFLTKKTLKYCTGISVRDRKSLEMLNNWGLDAQLLADPLFGEIKNCESHTGIGVQLRAFNTLTEEFLTGLANSICQNFPKEKIKLFSLQDSIDLPVIEDFAKILESNGCLVEIYKNLSPIECITEISKLEYLIGMRFHSCVAGVTSGVKVLGINYDIKVQTLAENVGFPLIKMYGCEAKTGIEKLLEVNPENYKLPKFEFPKW